MSSDRSSVEPIADVRDNLHLRFLSFISASTGSNALALLHLFNLVEPLSCHLEVWAPLLLNSSYAEGAVCCRDLVTPIGAVAKARVRESDVVAIEISLSDFIVH